MKSILRWIKEGLDKFKSPYPKEPSLSLKEWIYGFIEMTVFSLFLLVCWFGLYIIVEM